jgi:urea transport system permease protein
MITGFLLRALDRRISIAIGIILAIAVLVPASNLLLPADSAFRIPTYIMSMLGKYLAYALLALALDLVWGYCGILSLGRLLRARRLCHGHVSDAADRHARCLRPSCAA